MNYITLSISLIFLMLPNQIIAETNTALQKESSTLESNLNQYGAMSKEVSADYKKLAENSKDIEYKIYNLLKALKIDEAILASNNVQIEKDYLNVGTAYYMHKQHRTALFFLEKSAQLNNKYNNSEKGKVEIYSTLATVYNSYGNYQKALDSLKKVLLIQEKLFGKNHDKTKVTRMNIEYEEKKLNLK